MFARTGSSLWSSASVRSLKRKRAILYCILIFVGTAAVYKNGNASSDFPILLGDPVTSFCSGKADRRGPNQDVISYSLYGNFSDPRHYNRYAGAISYILSNISQVYPGI